MSDTVDTETPPESKSSSVMPESARKRYAHSIAAPIVILLPLGIWAAISSAGRVPVPANGGTAPAAVANDSRINPNTAPWYELTALPRIGETMARRIVAYREEQRSDSNPDAPVFRRAEDLANVHGIGPKTVERLRPYVKFE